ncbi:MAG: hypothetical protein ACLTYW_10040 [Collinsella sp.]
MMHAGEVAAPARTHATVQLDTSAAAFVAEKAREAAAEAAREAEKPPAAVAASCWRAQDGGQAAGWRGAALAAVWRSGARAEPTDEQKQEAPAAEEAARRRGRREPEPAGAQ